MGPKLGAGFSRVLSKLDRPEILDMILSKKDNNNVGAPTSIAERIKDELNYTQSQSFLNTS